MLAVRTEARQRRHRDPVLECYVADFDGTKELGHWCGHIGVGYVQEECVKLERSEKGEQEKELLERTLQNHDRLGARAYIGPRTLSQARANPHGSR